MNYAVAPGSMIDSALLGAKEDIYYYGSNTMKKQSIPTIQRTNFRQTLASKVGGASVITISPAEGISHIILALKQVAGNGTTDYAGYALPRGWLYSAIDKIQWRYGSTQVFEQSGQALLIQMLTTSGGLEESNRLFQLAGAECNAPADFGAEIPIAEGSDIMILNDKLYAYGILPMPHCQAQSGTDVPNPFPSELLSAPITVTVFLKPLASVYLKASSSVGALPSTTNNGWDDAYVQVRQINALDRGQLEKISPSHRYGFPITFYQQVNSVNLQSTASSQAVNLTGFQSGSCRGIYVWCVDTSDTDVANGNIVNPNQFVSLRDLQLSYQGNVLHDYRGISGTALDVLFTTTPSLLQNSVLESTGATTWTSYPAVSYFTHFPMQQRFEQLSSEYVDVKGVYVANGIMNLTLTTPEAKSSYKLYYMPYYSAALHMHQGAVEYVF